jgi:hypothetical protein
MTLGQKLRVDSWADGAHSIVGCSGPPTDLHAVARLRRVKRAGLRLMIPRGVVVPVLGGFEVFVRDLAPRELNLEAPEPSGLLTPRQRFAFAHEIVHTMFYKGVQDYPIATGAVKNPLDLEDICDRGAKRLLVPTDLLRREIRQELGDCRRIDARFVRSMVAKFRTSYDVMISRLSVVESENAFSRCILLVRKGRGGAQVSASYFGLGLASILPFPPKRDYPVLGWFPGFPTDVVERDEGGKWEVIIKGRGLVIGKTPLGRTSDFLLQVDAA